MYVVFVNEERTRKVELDERGAWLAVRDQTAETWGPPELLDPETPESRLALDAAFPKGRNRFVLSVDIEMTHPLTGDTAVAAAELAAADVGKFLVGEQWGFGTARVLAVYAPKSQFARGDFVPVGEASS